MAHGFFGSDADGFHGFLYFFDDGDYLLWKGITLTLGLACVSLICTDLTDYPTSLAYGFDVPITANMWACFLSEESRKHEAKPSVSVNPVLPARNNIKNP